MYLVTPPVKKIELHFPLGLEVSARNLKGVTIKDAMDAIYKQYKKKASLDSSHLPGIHSRCPRHSIPWHMLTHHHRRTTNSKARS